jgi:exodeoxyribonuclease VII small subunit
MALRLERLRHQRSGGGRTRRPVAAQDFERGYSVARDARGQVLRRVAQFPAGTTFRLRVSDGEVPARAGSPDGEGTHLAQQLERLEAIVRRLESQDLDLDEALNCSRGIEGVRAMRERLSSAEATVKQVIADKAGVLRAEDLDE